MSQLEKIYNGNKEEKVEVVEATEAPKVEEVVEATDTHSMLRNLDFDKNLDSSELDEVLAEGIFGMSGTYEDEKMNIVFEYSFTTVEFKSLIPLSQAFDKIQEEFNSKGIKDINRITELLKSSVQAYKYENGELARKLKVENLNFSQQIYLFTELLDRTKEEIDTFRTKNLNREQRRKEQRKK